MDFASYWAQRLSFSAAELPAVAVLRGIERATKARHSPLSAAQLMSDAHAESGQDAAA